MKEFIFATAWPMERPEFGSLVHILYLVIGLILVIVGAILLRKTGKKANNIVLFCIGITLFFLELYDQLFMTFVMGKGKYNGWWIPFQLCDVPIYMCLILPFMPECKLKTWTYQFLATYSLFGGLISVVERAGLTFSYVTLTFNGFVSHHILVFMGLYLITSGRACKKLTDFIPAVIIFYGLVGIAQLLNVIFQAHHPALFYISPFNATPLAVFSDIEKAIGWVGNMCVYTVALSIAAFLVLLVALGVRKLYARNKAKREGVVVQKESVEVIEERQKKEAEE